MLMIKVLFSYLFLECFTMFIFGILASLNAISAHSSTGLIKSLILDILVLGLELSANTTSFSF